MTDQVEATTAASKLRALLVREQDEDVVDAIARAYAAVAARVQNPADVEAAASTLRELLEEARFPQIDSRLGVIYATVAAQLGQASARTEAISLRSWARSARISTGLALAYASVAMRLDNAEELKIAASALRKQLDQPSAQNWLKPT